MKGRNEAGKPRSYPPKGRAVFLASRPALHGCGLLLFQFMLGFTGGFVDET